MEAAGKRYIWHGSCSDKFRIWNLSDLHLGSKGCAEKDIRRDVEEIANDPYSFWLGGGDYCLPARSEVLTKRGFVPIHSVTCGEEVLAYKDGTTFWDKAIAVYCAGDQPMIRLHSQTFDVTCTPNHEWIAMDAKRRITTPHLPRNHGRRLRALAKHLPHKSRTHSLKTQQRILVSAPCRESGDLPITTQEAWLLGWLATDGWVSIKSPNSFVAGISQSNKKYAGEIKSRLGGWITKEYISGECSNFNLRAPMIRELFERIGVLPNAFRMYYPSIVTRLSATCRAEMLDAMLKAEGWFEKRWRWAQKPGPILDAFVILATLEGMRVGLGTMAKNGVYTTSLMKRDVVTVADLKRDVLPPEEAWCIKTTSGSFVTRIDRQIAITGNCEFIGYSDKRFDPDAVAEWISVKDLGNLGMKSMQKVRDTLMPIRHKCLGLLIGNHELKYELHTDQESLHHWLCQELAVPHLGYSCFFDIHFCRKSKQKLPELHDSLPPRRGEDRHCDSSVFRVFAHHGAGYATTPGGKLNKLISAMNSFDADIYFLGHVHDQMGRKEPALSANKDCTQITQRMRLGVISGSYLKTYNQGSVSYGEQKMYRPTCLGAAVATIHPETRSMEGKI